MTQSRHLRGRGPLLPFDTLWDSEKDYLGLIVGLHDLDGRTVYGKVTHCRQGDEAVHLVVTDKNNTQTRHRIDHTTPARVLTQRRCPWCTAMFHPHHQGQRYCEPDHEAAYDVKCRTTRKLLQRICLDIGVACLSPTKSRYLSSAEAATGAKNARRDYGTSLDPYLCVCERWHLGHSAKTPKWLGSGNLDPTFPRISQFLKAHGIDTSAPAFRQAANAALKDYQPEHV